MSSNANTAGTSEAPGGMGFIEYIRIGRAYWKSITAVALAVTLMVSVWSALQPRIYSAESSVLVLTAGSADLNALLAGDALAKSKVTNYKSLAESRLVADRVIEAAGLDLTADALLGTVTITIPLETAELRIAVESTEPATAKRVADTWITELGKQVKQIEESSARTGADPATPPAVTLVTLDPAALPTEPVSPNVKLAVAFGLAGGLLLAYASALLRSHLDRRLRNAGEIERLFGVPVIGTLPVDDRLSGRSTVLETSSGVTAKSGPGSYAYAEALRELRTNLGFLDVDNPPRIILVTSSVPSEGKSTVAANLAATMAAAGDSVVVVDGDLRRPNIANVFSLVPGVGVTDVLSGHAKLVDVIQTREDLPNLLMLGAGRIPPNPSELLGSKAMEQMLTSLAVRATVLIDAPPLLPVTDAAVLSRVADGVIVVVKAGSTTRDDLAKSLGNLTKVKGTVLGTILNCVPATGIDSYAYYGSYVAASADEAASADPAAGVEVSAPRVQIAQDVETLIREVQRGAAKPVETKPRGVGNSARPIRKSA
jgi:capsular exopolysaccharide synthesis family protein